MDIKSLPKEELAKIIQKEWNGARTHANGDPILEFVLRMEYERILELLSKLTDWNNINTIVVLPYVTSTIVERYAKLQQMNEVNEEMKKNGNSNT